MGFNGTGGGGSGVFRGCRVKRGGAAQSIPNTTLTKVQFDAVRYGDPTWWNAGNPTRITVPITGSYHVGAIIEWQSGSAVGSRYADIFWNNVSRLAEMAGGFATVATDNAQCVGSAIAPLTAGDFIECRVYQNTGGAQTLFPEADLCPDMFAYFLGF